jgi:hypothetical protein
MFCFIRETNWKILNSLEKQKNLLREQSVSQSVKTQNLGTNNILYVEYFCSASMTFFSQRVEEKVPLSFRENKMFYTSFPNTLT